MNKSVTAIITASLIGTAIALSTALAQNEKTEPQTNWSNLQFFAYPNGTTGIFDPATAKLYLYDSRIERCRSVRQFETLGKVTKNAQRQ